MREQKWVVMAKGADFHGIARRFSIDPIVARLIRNRDVVGDEAIQKYLYGGRTDLYDPFLMKDMDKAVATVAEAIAGKKRIRIIGDYDIDGICATYILSVGLKTLGAKVDYAIPDRIKDGYGINESLVADAHAAGVEVLLTCDNGIAAIAPLETAARFGMTVVVTDHHEVRSEQTKDGLREILPRASAVVNPKQRDCQYPFKGLCGAAVAYKLVEALFLHYRRTDAQDTILNPLLAFCAIATVGDVMELVDENRILVKLGLSCLHCTEHVGLRALIQANKLSVAEVDTYHIGFIIGPCLNATGRLDTAKRAMRLLECGQEQEAVQIAAELVELNASRKEMTEQETMRAVSCLEESGCLSDSVYVIYLPGCHESLAGIIAGRIRERYGKPAIVLTDARDGVKGSGRSIEGYSMFEKLQECSDLLREFGGHPMAAGLSLPKDNILELRKQLNARSGLCEADFVDKVRIDLQMPFSSVRRELISQLDMLRPFGKGNEKPLFAEKNVRVIGAELLGKHQNVLRMRLQGPDGVILPAVCFREAQILFALIQKKKELMITYYPQINQFRGRTTVQLVVVNYM